MENDAISSRQDIIKLLSRSMIGPTSPEDSTWLGNEVREQILSDGLDLGADSKYLQGPWYSTSGEEILPAKYAPIRMYGIGVLYPELATGFGTAAENEADESIIEGEESLENNDSVLADLETVSDPDDTDVPLESTFRPRSLAVSFRILDTTQELKVNVSGGIYKPIQIKRQGETECWWERETSHYETAFASLNDTKRIKFGDVELSLGVESRKQSDGTHICTVWLRNDSFADDAALLSKFALFQTRITVQVEKLLEYEIQNSDSVDSLTLLYADQVRRSIGHGCDSRVNYDQELKIWTIESISLPVYESKTSTPDISDDGRYYAISMHELGNWNTNSVSEIDRLLANYESWITELKEQAKALPLKFKEIADSHIENCLNFYTRMTAGWNLINKNDDVKSTFMHASLAMAHQRASSIVETRKLSIDEDGLTSIDGEEVLRTPASLTSTWRPFQIAFILANIESAIAEDLSEQHPVDVIWMPTGGGKTEAYLGLAAFTILWERKKSPERDQSLAKMSYTKVLMRYTLRLLTSQQVSRAASLICSLELIRRQSELVYGTRPIRIGAWLGSATTPNTREQALKKYRKLLQSHSDSSGFMLKRCPWCATKLGEIVNGRITGYKKIPLPYDIRQFRVKAHCENLKCEFYEELPVFEVDEDIYQSPPDFLVGTVDKFARLAWMFGKSNTNDLFSAQRIFGLTNGYRTMPPPRLFIQDELHLISGPLGSVDGLYEPALEALCRIGGNYSGRTPHIIASTATTKNFDSQLFALYGRTGELVPPPGISIEDSFFARVDFERPGKIYVGICAGGMAGFLKNQGKVLAILGHAAAVLANAKRISDPWWSNVAFFSSRRSLGQLDSLVETDLKSAFYQIRNLSGVSSAPIDEDGKQLSNRWMRNKRQLTAISSDDVGLVLEELSVGNERLESIDLCFATSMIEVGLDVPRLGLMTIVGQPKSASQYIQVSGRVGRSDSAPGLIISLLNPNVYRDRSHFENFTNWHSKLYASVEPASVTPFTKRSLDRTLGSVLTILIRILGNSNKVQNSIRNNWDAALRVYENRAALYGVRSISNLNEIASNLRAKALSLANEKAEWDAREKENQFIFDPGEVLGKDKDQTSWRVLNSMRSVDSDAGLQFSGDVFGRVINQRSVADPIEFGEL